MRLKYWLAFSVVALALAACTTTAQTPTGTAGLVAAAGDYKGIPQSMGADGHFTLGDPSAKVSLIDYSDFL
jgi:hypothetical protein